jgi:hypothetical protein
LFGHGKLRTKWEGPFKVIEVASHGVVTLQNGEGKLFKVNGQRIKVFLDAQLPEEELDIVNYIEFEITIRKKKVTMLNSV